MNVEILQQKGHNFLWIDNSLWMWDIPIERKVQKQMAEKAFGDVLVAGYGLGLVQKYLSENSNVTSITTIEKSKEVIDKVKQIYGEIYGEIILGDFYSDTIQDKFDCIIGDIWEDIIPEALEDYKKFKHKAQQLINSNGKILAWGQEFFEYLIKTKKFKNLK